MLDADEYLIRCHTQQAVNDKFLKAIARERLGYRQNMPTEVVWRRDHPINEDVAIRYTAARQGRFTSRDEMAELLRVNRDECFYCGTRGDLPCEHNRKAAA